MCEILCLQTPHISARAGPNRFDTAISTCPMYATKLARLWCLWSATKKVATKFFEPGAMVSTNRTNILELDVWKTHSGNVLIGDSSVNTLGDSGGVSGTY